MRARPVRRDQGHPGGQHPPDIRLAAASRCMSIVGVSSSRRTLHHFFIPDCCFVQPGGTYLNVEQAPCTRSKVCVSAHSARRCCLLPVNQVPHDKFGDWATIRQHLRIGRKYLGKHLHEFHIFYSHTEWYLIFLLCESNKNYNRSAIKLML